jgi:hypothetical protein
MNERIGLWHQCKRWEFIKGPCPMAPLEEHCEEDYYEEEQIDRVPRGVREPTKDRPRNWWAVERKSHPQAREVIAEAEAVVREYIKVQATAGARAAIQETIGAPAVSAGGQAWGLARVAHGIRGVERKELLALALTSALTAGAIALRSTGPGRVLATGLALEGLLASVFKWRSTTQGGGAKNKGFRENFLDVVSASQEG